ncbi:MAG: M1 family metallopeptidase [Chitinophagaceae bacterium]|nr:M1 family metallopeptidase [Chitinophagaceae bacterium]
MRTLLQQALLFAFLLHAACSFSQTTGYSGTGGNIDVKYYRCQWTIDPSATKQISGDVTIYFKTTLASVKKITLDLNNVHSFSAKYHGSTIATARPATNIIELTLPVTLPINQLDSVTITYSGTPPPVSGQAEGYQKKTVNTKNMIYTLSESYEDRDWWPCKADMQDKADSLDIYVTTPSIYTAAANGMLISTTSTGSNRTFYYKHRYPIASYLVAVAVSEYTINSRGTVNINGTNMPVDYYYLSNRAPTATQLKTMDRCKDELVAFSNGSIFGDYPFKDEKYGMYEFGWGGGMEHQTFSAMGWSSMTNWGVIAHELGHQWWGDKVTFSTWNHLWLAEGFARYCEALAAELVPALSQNPASVRNGFKSSANSATYAPYGCYMPNSSITNSTTLWNSPYGTTSYDRGAMVVSMLRKLMGDTKFFQACRNYLNDPALAYKSATTDDFKNHCEAVLGYNLDAFFNGYVYGGGYPTYTVKWGNNNKRINIELSSQTLNSAGTTTYFHTPVVLKIANSTATVDTTIVIYDQNGVLSYAGNGILGTRSGKILGYNLSFVPATVTFDADNETLAIGTVSADHARLDNVSLTLLDVKIIDFKGVERENGNLFSLLIAPTTDQANITLERSEDGIHFYSLGSMVSGNSTSSGVTYSFLDKKAFDRSVYYYRVKIIDDKGEVSYSKTLSIIRQNGEAEIGLSPNPAKNYIRISLSQGWQNRPVHYIICSSNGAIIKNEKVEAGSDITIGLANMTAGSYNIELISDTGKRVSKIFTVIY